MFSQLLSEQLFPGQQQRIHLGGLERSLVQHGILHLRCASANPELELAVAAAAGAPCHPLVQQAVVALEDAAACLAFLDPTWSTSLPGRCSLRVQRLRALSRRGLQLAAESALLLAPAPHQLHFAFIAHNQLYLLASCEHGDGDHMPGSGGGPSMLRMFSVHLPPGVLSGRWQLVPQAGSASELHGFAAAAYCEAGSTLFLLDSKGRLHRCQVDKAEGCKWQLLPASAWPLSQPPLDMRVQGSKLLAVEHTAGLDPGQDLLQVWQLHLPAAAAAAAAGVATEQRNWQKLQGSCLQLPAAMQGCTVAAAPFQGDQWLVLLRSSSYAASLPDPLTVVGAAGGANQAVGAAVAAAGEAAEGGAAGGGEVAVAIYDCASQSWTSPFQQPVPASFEELLARRHATQHASSLPPQQAATNPAVLGSAFFQEQARAAGPGSALQAAAQAAVQPGGVGDCLDEHRQEWQAAHSEAQRRQQREAVALLPDPLAGGITAVWRAWVLPPPCLFEIAAPELLPYDLRHAQAVRAALVPAAEAAAGANATRAGAATLGEAEAGAAVLGEAEAGAAAAGGSSSHSLSADSGTAGTSLMLQLASHPPLPPIPCPASAALQCGELQRLLEVADEEEGRLEAGEENTQAADGEHFGSGGSSSPTAYGSSGHHGNCSSRQGEAHRRQCHLLLVGLAPEEHAALQQLVRCLAGQSHAGLLEAGQLLEVARLADLLDAPALLAECTAVLECLTPGSDMFVPLLALAEARQYNCALQRLRLFYRHALVLHLLQGQEAMLPWVLHGLLAGVDSVLEACLEVAATWLPHQADLYLGSPDADLAALGSPAWQAASSEQQQKLHPLLQTFLRHCQRQLSSLQQQGTTAPAGKKARVARAGPFQSAVRPPPRSAAAQLPPTFPALLQQLQQAIKQLQHALPREQARQRQERTAAAFRQAEVQAQRQRQRITVAWAPP